MFLFFKNFLWTFNISNSFLFIFARLKTKVYILGSGIGGMSCAAVLANNGFEVTILEQNNYFGGKAHRISEQGFEFDTNVLPYQTKLSHTMGCS